MNNPDTSNVLPHTLPDNINLQREDEVYGTVVNTASLNQLVQVAQSVTSLHQLRAPLSDFIGREPEIEQLLLALGTPSEDTSLVCAICGRDGLGKTELALKVAHLLRDVYPDAQLFVSMRDAIPGSARNVVDMLREVVQGFDPTATLPSDIESLAAVYRGHLSGKRALILLDDLIDAAAIRPFLPPPNCALLITSRHHLSLGGRMTVFNLPIMQREEARKLLLAIAPRLNGDPSIDRLLEQCADLPLAVRVLGATLSYHDSLAPTYCLTSFSDETHIPKAHKNDDIGLLRILSIGVDLLHSMDPKLALRWSMLGICPAPFEAATAAAIWEETDQDALDGVLAQLTRSSLISYDSATARYRIHSLLRDIARTRRSPEDTELAHLRHAVYYLAIAREAQRRYRAGHDQLIIGLALFDFAWRHIEMAHIWATRQPSQEAVRLCRDYALIPQDILLRRLRPQEQISWFVTAVQAARQLGDRVGEHWSLINLGIGHMAMNDFQRASEVYQQSLVIARELGDRTREAQALAGLGDAAFLQEDLPRAIICYEQWLGIAHELGDQNGEGQALVNLGGAYTELGDVRNALKCLTRSLLILRKLGDRNAEAIVQNNLGLIYASQNDPARAIECYRQSIMLFQELGNTEYEIMVTWNLGELLAGQGQFDRAAKLLRMRVEYYQTIKHPDADYYAEMLAQVQARIPH